MEIKLTPWQEKHGLTVCPATAIDPKIPATALGVAVIYSPETALTSEKIHLVIESRSSDLRSQCDRRLQAASLPPVASLAVAFAAETLPDTAPDSVHAACRRQVILAGELRRELRPAMR